MTIDPSSSSSSSSTVTFDIIDFDFDEGDDDDMSSLIRHPPSDVAQRLVAMIETESRSHYIRRDYLPSRRSALRPSRHASAARAGVVTSETRAKIVKWLYECVDYLRLSREYVEMAVYNVDRLLLSTSPLSSSFASCLDDNQGNGKNILHDEHDLIEKALHDASTYQLVALSALYLVAKHAGSRKFSARTNVVDVRDFAAVSHNAHSPLEITQAELRILEGLKWRLSCPTSLNVARHALALFIHHTSSSSSSSTTTKTSHHDEYYDDDARLLPRRSFSTTSPPSRTSTSGSMLIESIRHRIELSVSNYDVVANSASPSTIAFASIIDSFGGSPSIVTAFGRIMKRHGINFAEHNASSLSTSSWWWVKPSSTPLLDSATFRTLSSDGVDQDRTKVGVERSMEDGAKGEVKSYDDGVGPLQDTSISQSFSSNDSPICVEEEVVDVAPKSLVAPYLKKKKKSTKEEEEEAGKSRRIKDDGAKGRREGRSIGIPRRWSDSPHNLADSSLLGSRSSLFHYRDRPRYLTSSMKMSNCNNSGRRGETPTPMMTVNTTTKMLPKNCTEDRQRERCSSQRNVFRHNHRQHPPSTNSKSGNGGSSGSTATKTTNTTTKAATRDASRGSADDGYGGRNVKTRVRRIPLEP
ncbi:hypothetical protein ACHAXA_011014 [Cyclostephanos tholiformis]|uniref:Cyclin N-terminal domain-containing protein n=1 Tax=Cyclostephanos tholiformis TaxID=382380 RepID=A0ABD3R320_9STRA